MVTLTFGSLFSGIGGADYGLEQAGLTCKWQVEIDNFCQKVLQKHWPDVSRYSDVMEVGCDELETTDVIWGSPPCQPHSLAGKQRGEKDYRDLWPEYFRIVAGKHPRWFVCENVLGIEFTILDKMLFEMESEGYEVAAFNIPACAFDANHRRERIFVIGHDANVNSNSIQQQEGSGEQKTWPPFPFESAWEQHTQLQFAGLDVLSRSDNRRRTYRWTPEPPFRRVVYGSASRLDKRRIRAIGNAVVPSVARFIGECIVGVECSGLTKAN